LTEILKVRIHDSNALFCKIMLSNPLHEKKPCISLRVFLFFSCQVSLAEYIRVLRVLSHHVAGEVLGLLKIVANRWWARRLYIYFSSICYRWRMSNYASSVFETHVIVTILKLCCFSYHICKLDNILLFVNSIVNIISTATPCM
jgi:hypothetical protein